MSTLSAPHAPAVPRRGGPRFVTDAGMETDLIFHHGVDLPEFAAFPLVSSDAGRALLRAYYEGFVRVARRVGVGVLLETPTWRASEDWGVRLGYDASEVAECNRRAVRFLQEYRDNACTDIPCALVSGMIGPRGDGYHANAMTVEDARDYHSPQVRSMAEVGVDLVSAYTLGTVAEAVGIVRAARAEQLPVAISFTVETDSMLPDGTSLTRAITEVDEQAPPDYFLVNCAHPTHILAALEARDGPLETTAWMDRIIGTRINASAASHTELDNATELDEGDPAQLATAQDALEAALDGLTVVGGCCGTDVRHVAAFWGVTPLTRSWPPIRRWGEAQLSG